MPITSLTATLFLGILIPLWVYILISVKGVFGGNDFAE